MPGAVVDVGAMTQAVDRLCALQPVHVEGVSDELEDEIHEVITKVLGALGTRDGHEYLHAVIRERFSIQREFDAIDQLVVTFG